MGWKEGRVEGDQNSVFFALFSYCFPYLTKAKRGDWKEWNGQRASWDHEFQISWKAYRLLYAQRDSEQKNIALFFLIYSTQTRFPLELACWS